jgi:hypothetical protein
MCRNFQEGDPVVVNYPHGQSRPGTVIEQSKPGAWCVVFDSANSAEECDQHVPESYLEVPGQFLEKTASA